MLNEIKSAYGGFDIISVGAATCDIFVKSSAFTLEKDRLFLPASSKNEIDTGLISSGGGATNSSVSFSRLGLRSACVSLMGNDPLSLFVFNDLKANHVDTTLLVHPEREATDFSVILVAADGSRTVLTNRGRSCLNESLINWDRLLYASWFYITSLEGNLDLLEQLVGFAVEHQIKISLNPGNRELSQLPRLVPLLPYVDFLLLNRTEALALTRLDTASDDELWSKLLPFNAKITAITNGREGAHILTSTDRFYSPILETHPVDETGAGDAFGSAFVAALFHKLTPEQALQWGIKNSASAVAALGAKPGLLTLEQIK